jgi:hypothetical protein
MSGRRIGNGGEGYRNRGDMLDAIESLVQLGQAFLRANGR